jgi:hypothetical protein
MEFLIMPPALVSIPQRHTHGDTDFDGNGPLFKIWVGLEITRESVLHAFWATHFIETKDNHTTFESTGSVALYDISNDFPGYKLTRVISPSSFNYEGVDTDHNVNTYNIGSGSHSLVKSIEVMGDSDGGVFGGRDNPWVTVNFNPIRVEISEPGVFTMKPNWGLFPFSTVPINRTIQPVKM